MTATVIGVLQLPFKLCKLKRKENRKHASSKHVNFPSKLAYIEKKKKMSGLHEVVSSNIYRSHDTHKECTTL